MRRSILVPCVVLFLAAVLLLIPFQVDPYGYLTGVWMDFLHLPFAVMVFYCVHAVLDSRSRFSSRPGLSGLLTLAGLLLAECIQHLTGRSFSFYDGLYDVLGVAFGMTLVSRLLFNVQKTGVLLFILLLGLIIPLHSTWIVWRMSQDWPLITDFSNPRVDRFIEFSGLDSEQPGTYVINGEYPYPGVFFESPVRDWTGWSSLRLHVTFEKQQPVTVRIDDRSRAETYSERFQYEVEVSAGAQMICIPLDQGLKTSGGREMDLSRIYRVGVIVDGANPGQKFSIQKLELSSAGCY